MKGLDELQLLETGTKVSLKSDTLKKAVSGPLQGYEMIGGKVFIIVGEKTKRLINLDFVHEISLD